MVQKLALAMAATISVLLPAQAQQARPPEFDVASVKPNHTHSGATGGFGKGEGGGRDLTLKMFIAQAWHVQDFQVVGGPGWINSDRFDIQGKSADRNADPDQLRLMLRSLLEGRFQLKLHHETRESPVYDLVLAKGGSKMKASSDQISPTVDGPPPKGAGPNRGAVRLNAGVLIGNGVPFPLFVRVLSQHMDRIVLDKTGLTGRFDIQLQWTPDVGENNRGLTGEPFPAAEVFGPSLFGALQEQLGLKLESAKGPVEVLVIDHAEQPTEN